MAGAEWVRWAFAAMFALLTLFYVARLCTPRRDASAWGGTAHRDVDVSRGVMSVGMVAMLVPWFDPLPRLYWQVVFGMAAGHIAVRLIRRHVRSVPAPSPHLGGHHELHLLTGVAWAHVTVNPNTAPQGGYTKVSFRVPNERDNAATQLEVNIPTDHPIASVQIRALPGWTSTVRKTTLAKPITTDDGQVTEAVSKITWTGGRIPPGSFEEFDVSMRPLPTDTDQLVFKSLQTYDNGEVVRWIDTAEEGAPEPDHPVLKLTPADATPAATTTADTGSSAGIWGVVLGQRHGWCGLRHRPGCGIRVLRVAGGIDRVHPVVLARRDRQTRRAPRHAGRLGRPVSHKRRDSAASGTLRQRHES